MPPPSMDKSIQFATWTARCVPLSHNIHVEVVSSLRELGVDDVL